MKKKDANTKIKKLLAETFDVARKEDVSIYEFIGLVDSFKSILIRSQEVEEKK